MRLLVISPAPWGDFTIKAENGPIKVRVIDFRDQHDGAEFLGAYVPRTIFTKSIIEGILKDHVVLLHDLGKDGISIRGYGRHA